MRLHLTDLQYIGHRLTPDGVKPDPAKMAAIQEMAEPKTPQEVRRFLGMVNYLAKFLPNLSQVIEPLRKLTEGGRVQVGQRRRSNISNRKEHAVQ